MKQKAYKFSQSKHGSNMQNSNDLFNMLFRMVLKNTFNPNKTNPQDDRSENELILAVLGVLAFVGADALKVVFRKDFGTKGFSLWRVVISFIAFMIIAGVSYQMSSPEEEIDPTYGTHLTYLLACVFYVLLGFYVLIKGILHKRDTTRLNLNPEYKGDSHLLGSLIAKNGWSQENVQNWAEPLLTLAIGSLLAAINLLWGLPIIFCALSIWGHQFIHYLFGENTVNDKIQKYGYRNQNDEFSNVN